MPKGYTVNSFFDNRAVLIHVSWVVVDDSGVINRVTHANRLTRGKLMKQDDWSDWETSEFLQL